MANYDEERRRPRENDYKDGRDTDRRRPKEGSLQFKSLVRTVTPIWECYTCSTLLPADAMVCKCGETLGHALMRLPTYIGSAWACRQSHKLETRGYSTQDIVSVASTDMQCTRKSVRGAKCMSKKRECARPGKVFFVPLSRIFNEKFPLTFEN